MSATSRSETEMKNNIQKRLRTSTDPLEKLRLQCLSRGCSGIKGLGRMFRIIDDDGSRKLSLSEFEKGLHDYGVSLSSEDAKSIFQRLDKDNSGNIDFEEFLIALRPAMSKARLDIIAQAFKKMDKTGDGIVTLNDLQGVYDVSKHPKFQSGEMTKEQILKTFLISFEGSDHPDGMVTKDEFINYYAGVSASIDSDVYFDLMMRSAWKL